MPSFHAYVDLGSNTFQMLIAPFPSFEFREVFSNDGQIYSKEIFVLLRHAINAQGHISKAGLSRAQKALMHIRSILAHKNVQAIYVTATEVFRRYPSAQKVLQLAHTILGVRPRLIDGITEAQLGALAAQIEFDDVTTAWSMDIGGGSTEITFQRKGRMLFEISLPLGSTHLTRKFPSVTTPPISSDLQMRILDYIRRQWEKIPIYPSLSLIGIGGFFETLRRLTCQRQMLPDSFVHWQHAFLHHPKSHWLSYPIPNFRIPLLPICALLVRSFMEYQQTFRLYLATFSLKEGLWIAHCQNSPLFHRIFPESASTDSTTNEGP